MDWTKQAQDTIKTWTETQQKMWDGWLKTVGQSAAPTQATEVWQNAVETWEGAVKNTLEAQSEWTRMWVESLTESSNVPKEVTEWAKQAQEMSQRWSDAQQQLWQSWFEIIRKIDPAKMGGAWDKEAQKLFQTWQESTQKLMEAQLKWAKTWSPDKVKTKVGNGNK